MDIQEIKKIIALFEKSTVTEMELELHGSKIRLKKEMTSHDPMPVRSVDYLNPMTSLGAVAPITEDESGWVKAPLVGIIYFKPSPTSAPFVTLNQEVKPGDVVCVIEAMKVMNEIKAHQGGTITQLKADNGSMVEFNQKLICIGDRDAA